jgi:hypothetical protein
MWHFRRNVAHPLHGKKTMQRYGKELEYFINPEFYTDQNSKTKLRKSSQI